LDVAVGDPQHRGVERVEAGSPDAGGDLGADAGEREALLHDDHPVGLGDAAEQRLLVEGADRAQVEHAGGDALLLGEHLGGVEAGVHGLFHVTSVTSLPVAPESAAERDEELLVRDLALVRRTAARTP
jgi:hypothetical protein